MDAYKKAAAFADRIEAELRRLDLWQSDRPPDEAFESRRAFFGDTMAFSQWLQFVLLPRIRQIVADRGEFPADSNVGAYAVREYDTDYDAQSLVPILCEFDTFIDSLARK